MGAGNPKIRAFDEELYEAKTYFIDFSDNYKDEKTAVEQWIIDYDKKDEIVNLEEDDYSDKFNRILEYDLDNFIEDFFFNLSDEFKDWFHQVDTDDKYNSDLSYSFRGYGVIIAENDECLVVTTDEGENRHLPFALIPAFKLEDLEEEMYDEHIDKLNWYDARGLSLLDKTDKLAKDKYLKMLKKWKKDYEPFMQWLHKLYPLYSRNGAWTSSKIEHGHEFL